MAVLVPHLQRGFLARYLEQQRVTEAQLRELLFDAADDAGDRIIKLSSKEGIGATVRRAQLGVVRVELAGIIDETYRGGVERAIREGIERAALEGGSSFNTVLSVLEGQLGQLPGLREGIIAQARRGAANLVSRGMNNIPLSQQVYRTGALAKDQLFRTINSMIATGSSWSELAAEAKRFISPFTPGGAGYAAKRLARTELNNAFHTTQIRTTLKNPFVEGYKWNLSGSHPRPDQCNVYADWNGTGIFSKHEVPGKPHPNCLCFLTYVTPSVEEFQDKFLRGDYDRWLDDYIEENVPHLSAQLNKALKARPKVPAKRVQRGAESRKPTFEENLAKRERAAKRPPAREGPALQGQAARERLDELYGGRLRIEDEARGREVVDDLAKVPESVHVRLQNHFLGGSDDAGIYVGSKNITELDKMGMLRGKQPRGWSEGKTWDDVPGAYSPGIRRLLIGPNKGHGSVDLSLHEFGHGVDAALGDISHSARWVKMYTEIFRLAETRMSPYFKQSGFPGKEELFAELFGAVYGKPGDLDIAFDIIGGGLRLTKEERDMATKVINWFEKNVAPRRRAK